MEQRWCQHIDKMRKGTAAKSMQLEYNIAGTPSSEILLVCHKDHLDMMESMYINARLIQVPERMLNTSIPKDYTNAEIYTVTKNEEYLKYSIVQLIHQASTAKANISNLEDAIPYDVKSLKRQVQDLIQINQQLSVEANKSWLQRLLS
jgi:hypothetical protein